MAEWRKFVKSATTEEVKKTESFKQIPLKQVFKINNAEIVETVYGYKVVVDLEDISGDVDRRYAFPSLAKHFIDENGDLLPKESWIKEIGFECVDPYKFHYKK